MKFDLSFPNNQLGSFDEGVEFAILNLDVGREWIPLHFYATRRITFRDERISIGNISAQHSFFNLRGYNVSFSVSTTSKHNVRLKICGSEIVQKNAVLNFRWLQTSEGPTVANVDRTLLDNVQISISSPRHYELFMDDFNHQDAIKFVVWLH